MWWMLAVAAAADWPLIQGTEVGRPDVPVQVGGFLQADIEAGVFNPAVEDGRTPTFNASPRPAIAIRRARPILRGAIPGTDQRISWLMSAEFGQGALTRTSPVVLTDASVTFSAAKWFHVRVGRFKLPLMEEALEANPLTAQFIAFSEPARTLVSENPIANGAYTGGASGFRDIGVQVFGAVEAGSFVASGQWMVSNGGKELDPYYDVTGRVHLAWTFGDKLTDPWRDEVGVTAWRQQGHRVVDGEPGLRIREGIGVQARRGPVQARAELVHARGMVELGNAWAGDPLEVDVDGVAAGAVAEVGVEVWKFAAAARWSGLWTEPAAWNTATFALRWHPVSRAHVEVNYEARWQDADDPARGAAQGDRVMASTTVVF